MADAKENEDYQPTSVLLTGGAGFIGSHVLVHLTQTYPDVKFVCLDAVLYCSTERNFEEIKDNANFKFVRGDILSRDLVKYLMKTEKVDTVMHFAAQTHVDNSFGNSLEFTKTNVVGTHVLLECARELMPQIRRFIHVSTDEVYGESELGEGGKTIADNLDPTNPYAASKAAAEFVAKSYAHSFKMPIIITRGNNVYGPKQYPEKLIPKFTHLLNQGKPCTMHGTGLSLRSFLHVHDVARAFETILLKGKIGMIYNIGTDIEITNLDVAKTLIKAFGLQDEEDKYIVHVRDRHFNDQRYHIDSSDLIALGWKEEIGFDEGLTMTKEWYLNNVDHWGDVSDVLVAHPVVRDIGGAK